MKTKTYQKKKHQIINSGESKSAIECQKYNLWIEYVYSNSRDPKLTNN